MTWGPIQYLCLVGTIPMVIAFGWGLADNDKILNRWRVGVTLSLYVIIMLLGRIAIALNTLATR